MGVTFIMNTIFEWPKVCNKVREVIENLPHASRPSTSVNEDNIEKVKETLLENLRVGNRAIAEDLNWRPGGHPSRGLLQACKMK